ncbi:MAG: CBS domain-containing protein, partial [Microbacterium sp.]
MKSKPEKQPLDLDALIAADVMHRDIVTVRASDTIDEVERVLADAHVSGVPVIGDTGRIIGILSTSDLVDRYADAEETDDAVFGAANDDGDQEIVRYHPEERAVCAADVMTPEIESIPSSTPLREVARRMVAGEIHRLLVVDEGRLVG